MQSRIYSPQPCDEIIRVELELTSACNLACPLCMREKVQLPNKIEYRNIQEIINQLDTYTALEYVTIAGAISEPTTHPDLFSLIVYLKRRQIEISLYINGDTHTDSYYRQLGAVFNGSIGHVYFTICGSTQELHEKYRVGSCIDRVLRRLDIVNRFSGNLGILTWIVFNYNEDDFKQHYKEYQQKYNTEYFYTLPVAEHFNQPSTIHLPNRLRDQYLDSIDRNDVPTSCPAVEHCFVQIDFVGSVHPCSLHRVYGEHRCFECSSKNRTMMRQNKIFNVAEAESSTSELPMRLHT